MTAPSVSPVAGRLYEALGPLAEQDEDYDWPLLRFVDVVSAPIADVDSLASETDDHPVWGPLLDPAVCPAKALPWLGQLVGAVVPTGSPEATARAIVTHSPGWARGTPASLVAAAQLWLSASRHVVLTERPGGDAYAVTVTVYSAEVIDLASLTAAVQAATPAGLILTINAIDGWTVNEMETETAANDVAYVEATWATVTDFERQLP